MNDISYIDPKTIIVEMNTPKPKPLIKPKPKKTIHNKKENFRRLPCDYIISFKGYQPIPRYQT